MLDNAGPVFIFFIPLFHYFQGAKLTDPSIVYWSVYFAAVSAFCQSSNALEMHNYLTRLYERGLEVVFQVVPEPS